MVITLLIIWVALITVSLYLINAGRDRHENDNE